MPQPYSPDCIAFVLPSESALPSLSTGGFVQKRLRHDTLEVFKRTTESELAAVLLPGKPVPRFHGTASCSVGALKFH